MARTNRHEWLAEPLLGIEGAVMRTMFGCRSLYARGMLLLVLADGDEPWNGVLLPVERPQHAAALARWPSLSEHAILPKWLYLSESTEKFERIAQDIIREIAQGDPLYGVVPPPKKKRKAAQKPAPGKTGGNQDIPPHLR